MWLVLFLTVAILRFIVPFGIFAHPVATTIASIALDSVDGYLCYKSGFRHKTYHRYDKLMDWWWYLFILLYARHLPIFHLVFILFVYRTAGQILSVVRQSTLTLFWFPNILENFFIAYLLSTFVPFLAALLSFKLQPVTLALCALIAIIREYALHVKKLYAANYFWRLNINWERNEPKYRKKSR